jgi:hypothetical protein
MSTTSTINVVLDTTSFSARNPSANVTGVVYLQIGEYAFPGPVWSDFPVVILGWWLEGLTQLAQGEVSEIEMHFMDGPYKFTVTLVDAITARINLHTEDGLRSENVSFWTLFASAGAAGAAAVRECGIREWSNGDLTQLDRLVEKAAF